MLRKIILVLLVGSMVAACDMNGQFDLNTPFNLAYKQTKSNRAEDIRIKFEGVSSDSRCPADAVCVWMGNAEVKLTITSGSEQETFILNTAVEPMSRQMFGLRIELKNLLPPTSTEKSIAQWKYIASLVISKPEAPDKCDENSECGDEQFCQKEIGSCTDAGQCETIPTACTKELRPVCGCDSVTYSNACMAKANGINIAYEGDCKEPGHDTHCDDGTTPLCRRPTPECAADEILAYQNECFRCVNPATCLPWGEPGCVDDDDCDKGKVCDLCGSSSCSMCEDCVAACISK